MDIELPIVAMVEGRLPRKRKTELFPFLGRRTVAVPEIGMDEVVGRIVLKASPPTQSVTAVTSAGRSGLPIEMRLARGRFWSPVEDWTGPSGPADAFERAWMSNDLLNLPPHLGMLIGAPEADMELFSRIRDPRADLAEFSDDFEGRMDAVAAAVSDTLAMIGGRLHSNDLLPVGHMDPRPDRRLSLQEVETVPSSMRSHRRLMRYGLPMGLDVVGRLLDRGWSTDGTFVCEGEAEASIGLLTRDSDREIADHVVLRAKWLSGYLRGRVDTPFRSGVVELGRAKGDSPVDVRERVADLLDAPYVPGMNGDAEPVDMRQVDRFLALCAMAVDAIEPKPEQKLQM